MENKRGGLVIVGVGGTGVLKASEVISRVLMACRLDVRQSEVHGMAQRGGSVITHLRYGPTVYSPLLAEGEAGHMLAMEEMESLRYAQYLAPGATVVVNTWRFLPPGTRQKDYPKNIPETLEGRGFRVMTLPATEMAKETGSVKTTNTLMVGAFSALFPVASETVWTGVIDEVFDGKSLEANLAAFEKGRQYVLDNRKP